MKYIRKALQILFGKEKLSKCILFLQKASGIRLIILAYNQIGILNYKSFEESGEKFLLERIVRPNISDDECIIDIGANIGAYTKLVKSVIPKNRVLSIEPNPEAFIELLNINNDSFMNVISAQSGKVTFYISADKKATSHASLSPESISSSETTNEIEVESIRLSELVKRAQIETIGFLKIDVEGHERSVLEGGVELLPFIKFIQFEFNEKQIFTRTFLKDFYDILGETHELFRLNTNSLVDIREYKPINEIFVYQNIIAINKKLNFALNDMK